MVISVSFRIKANHQETILQGIQSTFWQYLEKMQKNLSFKEKWDLIASIVGGIQWNSGTDPFQSYDVLLSLRNELVHFKGSFSDTDTAPTKKITSLLDRFKGESNWKLDAMGVSPWVHMLLTAKELGEWIAQLVLDFDVRMMEFLTGKSITEEEKQKILLKRKLFG